jgi:hypothetical protein
MPEIPEPNRSIPIVQQDGTPTDSFAYWLTLVTRTDIIVGTGSPEGVVEATIGQEYMDSSGTAGSIKYIKRDADIAGDRTKGWILI